MVSDLPYSNKIESGNILTTLNKASNPALTVIQFLFKFLPFSHWEPKFHVLVHKFPSKLLILGEGQVIDIA